MTGTVNLLFRTRLRMISWSTLSQLEPFDTADFCSILNITKESLEQRIQKAISYNRYAPSIFMKQMPAEISSVLQEKLYKYPGFFVQTRTLRRYSKNIAAHVLGYVGEVDRKTIDEDNYYQMGDYIGISGVEKTYENLLRGVKGKKNYMVDVHNRVTGAWEGGKYDVPAKLGTDITLTLDADLQEYGEKLMGKFTGSIVAIDPSSGEILTLVSAPSYDPGLLVGRGLSDNFQELTSDTLNPLFNRAVAASYPPGSTFKIINGLIGLQEKVLVPSDEFYCNMGYYYKGIHVGCHDHMSPLDLREGIQISCNAYFCNVLRRIMEDPKFSRTDSAFNNWRRYVTSFGFGERLGSDIPGELKGFVPQSTYYDKYYGPGHWSFLTIISLAIGQGELGITPMQMANMAATISNRGSYYVPHVLKNVNNNALPIRLLRQDIIRISTVPILKWQSMEWMLLLTAAPEARPESPNWMMLRFVVKQERRKTRSGPIIPFLLPSHPGKILRLPLPSMSKMWDLELPGQPPLPV